MAYNAFIHQLTTIFGRRIEVVTGRNGYTIGIARHSEMMKVDGMYIILEKPPENDLKQIFDKAFILPARIVDAHFITKDPEKVKYSYSLPGDKLRFKFYQQMHKIYEFENPSLLIKTIIFTSSRRNLKISKQEFSRLNKHGGTILLLCITEDSRLIDIVEKPVNMITFPEGHNTKAIPIDLSQPGLERLTLFTKPATLTDYAPSAHATSTTTKPTCFQNPNITPNLNLHSICLTCPVQAECLNRGKDPNAKETDAALKQSTLFRNVDNYMVRGMHIILTFPEGKEAMVLDCVISEQKRVPIEQVK